MGRTNIKGYKQTKRTYKRQSVDTWEKVAVLGSLDEYGMAKTINVFYPSLPPSQRRQNKRQIYRWREKADVIERAVSDGSGSLKKIRSTGTALVLSMETEEQIVMWINDLRKEGLVVTPLMLQIKAQQGAEVLGIAPEDFSASRSWRKAFMARHTMSLRRKTRAGQCTPEDGQRVAQSFAKEISDVIAAHSITEIYNADQTAVNYEYPPSATIDHRGCRTIWVRSSGKEKERVSVMLLADSTGTKRAPFAVIKQLPSTKPDTEAFNHGHQHGFGKTLWREMKTHTERTGIPIYGNKRGWWNAYLSLEFLLFHFAERDSIDEMVLLLWDDFSGHWTPAVQKYVATINVVLLKVPARYTAVCQPAWMRPLKMRLRYKWVQHLRAQLMQHQESEDGAAFDVKAPSRSMLIDWLNDSWGDLSRATVAAGFKKLSICSDSRPPATSDNQTAYDIAVIVDKLKEVDLAKEMDAVKVSE